MSTTTRDIERAYVRRWVETGRLLEDLRWRELRCLDEKGALAASDYLIEAALLAKPPAETPERSGLVVWQDLVRPRLTS